MQAFINLNALNLLILLNILLSVTKLGMRRPFPEQPVPFKCCCATERQFRKASTL